MKLTNYIPILSLLFQLLREIQAMLDASVLLMQQYSTVVANLPQTSATVSTQTELM